MWIFGYGSLVWYTNFETEEAVPGLVKGFGRRFWQASPDHRGTPDKPGRTVTLVPADEEETWGIAYKVPAQNVESVRKYLNWREKAGYEAMEVMFYPRAGTGYQPFQVEVFVSPEADNPYYLGPQPITAIAEEVVSCIGPSGTNIEYVLRLVNSLRKLNPDFHEPHLHELETEVVRLCRERGIQDSTLIEFGYVKAVVEDAACAVVMQNEQGNCVSK